tara:strand:- start:6118 stop:6648 length:531 start_codon:yes stop_codon:yes gene_type:complete
MQYIIENLEPKLSKWCILEYSHIIKIVKNPLFTNIKPTNKLKAEQKSTPVKKLNLKNACILDPNAKKTLTPSDKFDYLIFGGILGDDPPQKRTNLINMKAEKRNLGKEQMSTDTAVLVAKLITEGTPLENLKFKDEIEIPMQDNESVILPFRYLIENNKPVLAEGLIEYLKKKQSF